MEFNIQHDEQEQRFYAKIGGKTVELQYNKIDNKTLEYYRTFVPEQFRGRGIAGKITQHALDYARKHNFQIIPTCSFVRKYIEEHTEYSDIVKK